MTKKVILITEEQFGRLVEYAITPNVSDQTSVGNLFTKNLSFNNKLSFKPKKPVTKSKPKKPVTKSVLDYYLVSRPELIPIYREIEKSLGDKFVKNHFQKEINYSGGLKKITNGVSQNAMTMFNKMLEKYNLKGKVKVSDNSYRDYQKQKNTFIEMAKKHGGKIKDGLRQAALPGFSQHHTGKALDVSPSSLITDKMLQEFGFKRPYKTDTGFRMPEPWHILYTK